VLISQTGKDFPFLPDKTMVQDVSRPGEFKTVLPSLSRIRGSRKDGDHSAMLSYLAEEIPKLSANVGVIFSSKAVLRRYFFDLIAVLPDTILVLGEDLSGGMGKFRDRYVTSDAKTKVLFLTYRNLRIFPPELLDFSTIFLQSLPFDPPGLPIHQARQMNVPNSFVDYALPRAKENLLLILSTFSRKPGEKDLIILDRRIQEQNYGDEFLKVLQ
jgi:Rad3-related DNA helicase